MSINSRLTTFAGLPVVAWDAEPDPPDPAGVAWRVQVDDSEDDHADFAAVLEGLLARTGAGGPTALVVGLWDAPYERNSPMNLLVRNAERLGALRAVFIGDMTSEECEISWISQSDVTPLLRAFPRLERLGVRGADGLALSPLRHTGLRELVLQSGGLPGEVVRALAASDLPALTDLELWLGVEGYGGTVTLDDLAPILTGRALPALTRLGLRNAETADEIAAGVAAAPVVARLTELDLSLGTLGDAGAEALLAGQPLTHLTALDLSHHFISAELAQRLVDELPGVRVDVSDPQDEDEGDRYTAVDE